MACFLVPTAEAIVVTIVTKAVKAKEKESETRRVDSDSDTFDLRTKLPFSRKLKWLTNMLWGGAALLAFEHVWHGEVVPWFPFLTAASNPTDTAAMLHEMSTVGVGMAILVTAVWGCMLAVSHAAQKKALKAPVSQTAEN